MKGHIRRRSEGSWTLVIERGLDPATGKRRQLWKTVKGTKKMAEAELAKLINQMETGNDIESTKVTLEAYLQRWLESCERRLKPRTLQRYRELMELHVVPVIGRQQLQKVRALHVENALEGIRRKGLSDQTALHVYRVLFTALERAVKWRLIERNVAASVVPPKPQKRHVAPLDPSDVAKLLAAVEATSVKVPTVLAIGTGMRLGEVLGLRWSDVDLKDGSLKVVQTLQVDRTFGTPKTHRSTRPIGLPQFAIDTLQAHKRRQAQERLIAGDAWHEFDLVVARPDGTPMDPRRVSRLFRSASRTAGLDLSFHGLRHAYASLMLLVGVDLKVISGLLGHSSIGITADLYLHVAEKIEREAASKLDRLIGKG